MPPRSPFPFRFTARKILSSRPPTRRAHQRHGSTRRIPRALSPGTAFWILSALLLAFIGGRALAPSTVAPSRLPETARVRRVIDGDTIELASRQRVRYIGIDTPETRRRDGEHWRAVDEPFGREAKALNSRLVQGQRVRLEYDAQTHDVYGRVLAYVYCDELLVNAELLRQGYARLLTIPPNVAHIDTLRAAEQDARAARRGLWSRSP